MLDRWLASKVVIIAVGLVALFTSHTIAEEPILRFVACECSKGDRTIPLILSRDRLVYRG